MDFNTWAESLESEHTLQVSREITRDVYRAPNGIRIYHDVGFPSNPLKPQWERATVDYTLPMKEAQAIKDTFGAERLDPNWYTPDGFGLAQFKGDKAMELAYKFAMEVKS